MLLRWNPVVALALAGTLFAACAANISSVRKLEAEQNIPELIRILADKSSSDDAERAAEFALRRIGEPAVQPLIAKLQDDDSFVRFQVAYVLGRIGDHRATEPLLQALGKPDGSHPYSMRIATSLANLGNQRALDLLEASGLAIDDRIGILRQSQRCRADPACKREGRCGAIADRASASCEPRSDADCRSSDACANERRCFLGTGAAHCVTDFCADGKVRGCE